MTRKLSEITPASAVPAATDQLVGVSGGTTDLLYSFSLLRSFIGLTVLTGPITYYVRPDGSDSNNGLANTPAGAFLTIQHAVNVAYGLNLNGFGITIQLADNVWAENVTFAGPFIGQNGSSSVTLRGNPLLTANCVIAPPSGNCIDILQNAGPIFVNGLKLVAVGGVGLYMENGANCHIDQAIEFGDCSVAHTLITNHSFLVDETTISGFYVISGDAPVHWFTDAQALLVVQGRDINLVGARTFAFSFAYATDMSTQIINGNNFIIPGSATGKRFTVDALCLINTVGGGAGYLPGTIAGTTDALGKYA